jgi:apolipoprotein N-acyltransferase
MVSLPSAKAGNIGAIGFTTQSVFQIIGWATLAGFAIDMAVVALPPSLSLDWRITVLEQLSNRAVVLMLGTGFVISSLSSRRWLKLCAQSALLVGIGLILACLLVIYNGITLQNRTFTDINTQATQLQSQIQQVQQNPPKDLKLNLEELQKAAKQVDVQADSLRQNTQTKVMKASISSAGNLLVAGIGMVSLGRFGLYLRRSRSSNNYAG